MVAKPFTFTAGTFARSSQINANFDTIYSAVNTNTTDIASLEASMDNLDSSKADINGSSTERFQVDDAVNSYDAMNKQSFEKFTNNVKNYIDGYEITKDTNSPYDTVIVSAGSCYDSTYSTIITITSNTSVQNTSQGGNTTYYLHVISNDDGTSTKIIVSPSSVSPSLPTGYTKYRCVGKYTTSSSAYNNRILRITSYSNSLVGDIVPDYANAYALTISSTEATAYTKTILEDGWLEITLGISGTNESKYAYINGCRVASARGGSTSGIPDVSTSVVRVVAGDSLTFPVQSTTYFEELKLIPTRRV